MERVTAAVKGPTMLAVMPFRRRPLDAFLVFWFCLFAVSSLVFEQFIVFGVDLSTTTDIFGRTWYWYARSFDPIFLDTPQWLRIMCTIDAYVFGPFYLVLIYALAREKNWIRVPALLYGATIVYSTIVYFGYEFLDEANRAEANLLAVFLVNIPFTVVPLLLMWRMRQPDPFRANPAPGPSDHHRA
jgi:hypothetical protein